MKLVIYLNSEGDGFEIRKNSLPLSVGEITELDPIFAKMLEANTQEEIEGILNKLSGLIQPISSHSYYPSFLSNTERKLYEFNSCSNNGEKIELLLMHLHAPYEGHNSAPGNAHYHSIEEMLCFVKGLDRAATCS